MNLRTRGAVINDDPIVGDDVQADQLGRRDFARSAAQVLDDLRHSGVSSVVGLVGPWGGGKTSVLNMIKSTLEAENASDGDWLISTFNPWLYQDMATLQMAFFRELASALPGHGKGKNARKLLAKFGNAVAPLGSLAALLGGPDLSKPVQAISSLISPDESATKIQAQLEKTLHELGRPVLMVLDDLDRLAPDELLLTLKLIRLIGRLPNVYYIVAYDEETLLDCLSRTGLVGDDPRRGVDYLEKIIQVRLDVPPVRQHQLDEWVERSLLNLQERYELDFAGDAQRRLQHAFYGHIRERLTTPRAMKRYFGQVDAFLGDVHEEIDAVDFLVLTWFRTAEPLVYDMIERERSALLGEIKNIETADLFGKPDKDRLREFWALRLEGARVSRLHMEGVADLIGLLFPRFHAHWNREDMNQPSSPPPARRLQNSDYFDRYFAFRVPPEDISDLDARAALQQIVTHEDGSERALVESKITEDTNNLALALGKMTAVYQADLVGGAALLDWIARQRAKLSTDEDGMFTPEMRSRWAAQRVYLLLPVKDLPGAIDALAATEGGLELASHLVSAAANDQSVRWSPERAPHFDSAALRFAAAVRARFDQYAIVPVLDVPVDTWRLLYYWQIIDQADASAWIKSRIESGAWTLTDVLTRFVSTRRLVGVPDAPWTVGDLNIELLDRLLGVDDVVASLHDDITTADHIDPDVRRLEDTYENRRAVMLSQLDRERRRRELSSDISEAGPESE